ncbi:hypothetical protein J2X68_002964 [Streptomyces sp. 3330]|uniref:hypothetical protein n=1 Tax=Streptomyces sp. 3330 TaxID=2817755 RepID=UPI002860EBA7|nr:hypothetical protein [Streptomyces sp. 3330]MDR6976276.1 hypothetical protein [Streptomyces sp. 3330]
MTAHPLARGSSSPDAAHPPHREVTRSPGRVHRIGETDRDLLGRSATVAADVAPPLRRPGRSGASTSAALPRPAS